MPDPGLTDLIAAHVLSGPYIEYDSDGHHADDFYRCGEKCKWTSNEGTVNRSAFAAHAAHVALVVEQHTNGRMAELEAERDQAITHDRQPYPTAWAYEQACAALEKHRKRADKHEATVARVEAEAEELERMIRTAPWSRYTEVRRSHLRSLSAALEGPGEAG